MLFDDEPRRLDMGYVKMEDYIACEHVVQLQFLKGFHRFQLGHLQLGRDFAWEHMEFMLLP